jgi:NAD-dependent dihydropyrimidine dehydrogenase PreA subunit
MMLVDLEKCTGCGECLDACSVEAISLIEGKAAIDVDTCLSCGACAQACPVGAIMEIRRPVPVKSIAIQPVRPQTASPVVAARSESRLAWARPALSFLGREIVPHVAGALMAIIDRRRSTSSQAEVIYDSGKTPQIRASQLGDQQFIVKRRQVRRRRRGGKF